MKNEWIDTHKKKPSDEREVLVSLKSGDILIACYDGEDWYDTISGNVLSEPLYWLNIPLLPGE